MNEFRLKHVDHVVEVNQVTIDGNDIHFARVKSGPGDQAPNTVKSIYSHIIHCVLGAMAGTTPEDAAVGPKRRNREPK